MRQRRQQSWWEKYWQIIVGGGLILLLIVIMAGGVIIHVLTSTEPEKKVVQVIMTATAIPTATAPEATPVATAVPTTRDLLVYKFGVDLVSELEQTWDQLIELLPEKYSTSLRDQQQQHAAWLLKQGKINRERVLGLKAGYKFPEHGPAAKLFQGEYEREEMEPFVISVSIEEALKWCTGCIMDSFSYLDGNVERVSDQRVLIAIITLHYYHPGYATVGTTCPTWNIPRGVKFWLGTGSCSAVLGETTARR